MLNNSEIFRARKESVLSSIDIVELIGQTVALKRQGKDFIGLCPFHQERTPSFHVSPSKRFFHCFGCNANGNAIDFVMKRDRIDFASALRRLGGGGWRMSPPAAPARAQAEARAARRDERPSIRFNLLTIAHARAINADRLDRLAAQLGLSVDSLHRLSIGWAGARFCSKCMIERTAWSFPMTDAAGQVHGMRLRFVECGHKSAITGGHDGLFVPRDLDQSARLFICEGPTDTAAMLDLGLAAIGRPSCRGAVPLTTELLKVRRAAELIIIADGDGPGMDGARTLGVRARLFCPSVKILTPPAGVKDARQWKQQGATAGDVEQLVDAAPPIQLTIKTKVSKTSLLEGASSR